MHSHRKYLVGILDCKIHTNNVILKNFDVYLIMLRAGLEPATFGSLILKS